MPDDLCQRCGVTDEDCRTLWMACLYQMSELDLPLTQRAIRGQTLELDHLEEVGGKFKLMQAIWKEPTTEVRDHPFYTLRVCKECRAEWMEAISHWFYSAMKRRPSPGTGIFVRHLGTNVELTEEEWKRRHPDREPVRYLPKSDDDGDYNQSATSEKS